MLPNNGLVMLWMANVFNYFQIYEHWLHKICQRWYIIGIYRATKFKCTSRIENLRQLYEFIKVVVSPSLSFWLR